MARRLRRHSKDLHLAIFETEGIIAANIFEGAAGSAQVEKTPLGRPRPGAREVASREHTRKDGPAADVRMRRIDKRYRR